MVSSFSYDDAQTKKAIGNAYHTHGYLLDPHGAVAFLALSEYLSVHHRERGMILETAHPLKFAPIVEAVIGKKLEFPSSLQHLLNAKKSSVKMKPEFELLKEFLLTKGVN